MNDPARLISMAAAARQLGRPHAAQAIAQDLLQLAGVTSRLTADGSGLTAPSDSGFVKLTEVA